MRILANENFPALAVNALREQGHDVAWVHSDAPGSSDLDVLARAQAEFVGTVGWIILKVE